MQKQILASYKRKDNYNRQSVCPYRTDTSSLFTAICRHISAISSTWDGQRSSQSETLHGLSVWRRLFRRTVTALSAKYSTGPYRTGTRSTRFPETEQMEATTV